MEQGNEAAKGAAQGAKRFFPTLQLQLQEVV